MGSCKDSRRCMLQIEKERNNVSDYSTFTEVLCYSQQSALSFLVITYNIISLHIPWMLKNVDFFFSLTWNCYFGLTDHTLLVLHLLSSFSCNLFAFFHVNFDMKKGMCFSPTWVTVSVSGEMLFGISWKLFVELCLFFVHSCFSFFSQTFCFFLASEVQGSLSQRLATSPISCLFLKVNVFPYIEISGRSSMETIIRLYADCTSLLVQNDSDLLTYPQWWEHTFHKSDGNFA